MTHTIQMFAAAMFVLLFAGAIQGLSQSPGDQKNVTYAVIEGNELRLDLYMPRSVQQPFLVVWVHGGRWASGTKEDAQPGFVDSGFALASLDFRQSTQARFPAQVHDIKAAIRFLRAMAPKYGYRADKIAIAGSSSGGHLAALVGVSSGNKELEGTLGAHLDQSSAVQAIISYYGASNLTSILAQSTPFGLGVRVPALEMLLGARPESVPDLAKLASPVFHVDATDPPLLLLHGDQDPQMPINQSHELQGAYARHGLKASFDVVHGAVHGGPQFFEPKRLAQAVEFLRHAFESK